MASAREKVQLNSTGLNKAGKKTGYFKVTSRNKRKPGSEKLKMMCFDPRAYNKAEDKVGAHVLFEQGKMKK